MYNSQIKTSSFNLSIAFENNLRLGRIVPNRQWVIILNVNRLSTLVAAELVHIVSCSNKVRSLKLRNVLRILIKKLEILVSN